VRTIASAKEDNAECVTTTPFGRSRRSRGVELCMPDAVDENRDPIGIRGIAYCRLLKRAQLNQVGASGSFPFIASELMTNRSWASSIMKFNRFWPDIPDPAEDTLLPPSYPQQRYYHLQRSVQTNPTHISGPTPIPRSGNVPAGSHARSNSR